MKTPLADRVRPQTFEQVVGQQHLLAKGKLLNRMVVADHIPNMIFYGPSGTGKTTVANIIAGMTHKKLYKINASTASIKDIKEVIADLDTMLTAGGVLLYLDEIQNFNKKQQQSLLEYIENGKITLIASTTENPFFYVYNAILSRSTILQFKPLTAQDIEAAIFRAVVFLQDEMQGIPIHLQEGVARHIANTCGGDVRKALNVLEIAVFSTPPETSGDLLITLDTAMECAQNRSFQYDKFGDNHYDILSAFQKSIRGSDPDASIHYLARLVKAGDLPSICRRLLVIASEDIGLAYPTAITIVKACVDAALQVGFPEARINLAQAVLVLANAPKSNAACVAIDQALTDIDNIEIGEIPPHLKDSHYDGAQKLGQGQGYKYPHAYPNHYVKQQYLPDNIKHKKYYIAGENKAEQQAAQYHSTIKQQKE
ncbi:MAG: replication-associated recombination protein A [Hyphomonadaceae bacterium]|nr:replication-associated recombination protein A [Clostridia bacterium]